MPPKKTVLIFGAFSCVILLYLINMAYFSIKPDFFPVERRSEALPGMTFTETTMRLMENELYGHGGWTPNDIPPSPTWLLDNKPNFQLGILEVTRYTTRILRDSLSRQRTTDAIDPDCDKAFTSFSNDPYKWIMPSAEGKYKKGIEYLETYVQHLKYENARFYPRSDNLMQLLEQYASLLGGVNTRLLNASRKPMADNATAHNQEAANPVFEKIPWRKIDDNFYYAQGVGYALYHLFKAIRIDFAAVLKDKNADIIMNEIIASLEETQFEPLLIMDGGKDGIFANHSNNVRVFLDDARQKTNSLLTILSRG
ncbi:MAG: DUF2333 family protein [Pseudomonadota bacterium]